MSTVTLTETLDFVAHLCRTVERPDTDEERWSLLSSLRIARVELAGLEHRLAAEKPRPPAPPPRPTPINHKRKRSEQVPVTKRPPPKPGSTSPR